MPSRICLIVALGCAIFCWSDLASAQSRPMSALSGKIANPAGRAFSVQLKPIEKNPLAIYDGYSAQTAAEGEFQFEDVEPGRYVLVAEGAGFMPTEYGAEGM